MAAEVALHAVAMQGEQLLVHVSAGPFMKSERFPGDICVIIDVSGSMQQEAVVKDREADAPELSILDIVRHAVRTAIHTMGPQDRLGIVAYSDKATKILELTHMDEDGKASAEAALEKLHADGQTNLWDGLEVGLELLRTSQRDAATAAALLFTDGVPNVEPPGGHLASLLAYRQGVGGSLPATLNTFGFGGDLDSKLLDDLARDGGGLYVFIPDASFVGTALVNCTANALAAAGRNAELHLSLEAGITVEHVYGHQSTIAGAGDVYCVPLGALQLGQSKDVVMELRCSGEVVAGQRLMRAELRYCAPSGPSSTELEVMLDSGPGVPGELQLQICRLRLSEVTGRIQQLAGAGDFPAAARAAQSFLEELRRPELDRGDPRLEALCQDVEGQVAEAVSREDWYMSWGAHYLRSLARAHLSQQCSNFKDPGVQVYGGEIFERARDLADEMFLKLPPPAPSNRGKVAMLMAMGFDGDDAQRVLDFAYDDVETAISYLMEGLPARRPNPPRSALPAAGSAPAAVAAAVPRVVDMSAYYNSSGPCFSGDSSVLLAGPDCEEVPIRQLRRGDRLATIDGGAAELLCVVETRTADGTAALVELGKGLVVTPWHPVLVAGSWEFPATLAPAEIRSCEAVFNLVLSQGHTASVGGFWAVTLGHQLKGPVVEHAFWGTTSVLDELRRFQGWDKGKVMLQPGC
ncbi:unnamed protein product, partial [Polarella glacialis]